MRTVGIDTNVILTLKLAREPGYTKAKELLEKCLDGKVNIYIPTPVFLEVEWVLRSFYKQPKEKIVEFFEELLVIPNLLVDNKDQIKFSLNVYKQSTKVGFTDCVIIHQIQMHECEFFIFDQHLEKLYISLQ